MPLTGLCSPNFGFSMSQSRVNPRSIKTDNNLFPDSNNRNTPGSGYLNHFSRCLFVFTYIKFLVGNPFLRKILFRSVAMGSGGKAVYFYLFFHDYSSIPLSIILEKIRRYSLSSTFGRQVLLFQVVFFPSASSDIKNCRPVVKITEE